MIRVSAVRNLLNAEGLTSWESVNVKVSSSIDGKVKISCTRIGSVDEFRSFNEALQRVLGQGFSQADTWHEMSYLNQGNDKITIHIKRNPSTDKHEGTIEW